MQPVTEDPFAALYSAPVVPTHELYISGRLTLLRIPCGTCGDWISINSLWHRRLDSNAFLWLQLAISRTIESGKLSSDFADALETLDRIAAIGIEHGIFTADEIDSGQSAAEWYTFNAGLPTWVDEIGPDFLPPVERIGRPALTVGQS